jgi:DNA-binding NtrC family response regulator
MVPTPRSILHVDDDPNITSLLARRLTSRGYTVDSLNDPRQCISRLIGNRHRVVLLDVDMPGQDGLSLLKEIKSHDGGIQVIMLTGLVTMSSALQSLRWGAEACFFKPLPDIDPLVMALEDAFRKLDRWWQTLDDLSHRRRHEQMTHA